MKAVWTGFMTPRHLYLAAQYRRNLLPLRLPIRCRLQEKELSLQDAKSQGEGGDGRLSSQPIIAQRLALLTSWPRLRQQPLVIRLTEERPGPGQRPMTGRRWGVPQWSIHSSSPPLFCQKPPISAANQNRERASSQDHSENLGLYKLSPTDPRQDLTATQPRVNNSGLGLSSPAPKQPYTKPFSGLPSGLKVTSPYREVGGTFGGRPRIVYPLLPSATRPDTKLVIDATALPESAALGRQSRPPTVLDLEETREKENQPLSQSRRKPRKRRCHRSTGVYRPSKRSPPRGRWCD